MNEKKETGSPCCVNGHDQGHAYCEESDEGEERQNGQDAEAKERVAFGCQFPDFGPP